MRGCTFPRSVPLNHPWRFNSILQAWGKHLHERQEQEQCRAKQGEEGRGLLSAHVFLPSPPTPRNLNLES